MKMLAALFSGLLFGFGLTLSGMTNPAKVVNFLDLTGHWDPSLGFVMGGGLLVTLPAFFLARRRRAPLLDSRFHFSPRSDIDARLIVGAALFGAGWGLAGLCPGPAIASLWRGAPVILVFVAAMAAGMLLNDRLLQRPAAKTGSKASPSVVAGT